MATNQNIEQIYLNPDCIDYNAFDDFSNLMSLHLRLDQIKPLKIRLNHLTNLKELCLDYKNPAHSHPRETKYFSYLPTSLEKLSIIGFNVDLFELSYLSENLNFLELNLNTIYIDNQTPFDCFKNLISLKVNTTKIYFETDKPFEFEQIHFNLIISKN